MPIIKPFKKGQIVSARKLDHLRTEISRLSKFFAPGSSSQSSMGTSLFGRNPMPFWAFIKDHNAAGSYRDSSGNFSWIAAERWDTGSRMEWRESHGLRGEYDGVWPARAVDGRDYVPPGTLVLIHPSVNQEEVLFHHQAMEMGIIEAQLNAGGSDIDFSPYYWSNGTWTDVGFDIKVRFPTGKGNTIENQDFCYIEWFPDTDPTATTLGYWQVASAEC